MRLVSSVALAACVLLGRPAQGAETAVAVQTVAPGEAVIYYLGHCGYAVRTARHLLIFDYQEQREASEPKVRPAAPSLDNGWVDPNEIKGLAVRVFVTHSHTDHYDPIVLTWRAKVADIAYFFGWKAGTDPTDHYLVGPRATLSAGGLEIATINSHHSGVPEVAWLISVDGVVIYHNGDCQPANPSSEHDFLKTKAERIDVAFVPPLAGERERYAVQNLDLFRKFAPRMVFPMHGRSGDPMYVEFQKVLRQKLPELNVMVPRRMGERFRYRR